MFENTLMVEFFKELKLFKILGLEVILHVRFSPCVISLPD